MRTKEEIEKDLRKGPEQHGAGQTWYQGESVRTLKILAEVLTDIRDLLTQHNSEV